MVSESKRTHGSCVPTGGYSSRFNGDGRTDRASLQEATHLALTGTDARIVRPYISLFVSSSYSSHQVTREICGVEFTGLSVGLHI